MAELVTAGMLTALGGAVPTSTALAETAPTDSTPTDSVPVLADADDALPVIDAAPGTVLSSMPAPAPSEAGSGGGGSSAATGGAGDDAEAVALDARIMRFATRDGAGRGREVGGVVVVPQVPWAGRGPRPTGVVAPGTVGQADKCAPSATFGDSPGGGQIGQVQPLLDQGFRVVVSDYIGLGAPGVHTYANRLDQGQTLLDAARADLSQVLDRIDGNMIMGAIGYAVNGLLASEPQLRPLMDEIASPYGRRILSELEQDCIGDSVERVGLHRTNSWTVDGRSLSDRFAEHPEIVAALDHHRIGRLKPNAPVPVLNGRNDDVIPFGQAEQMARDWCAQGGHRIRNRAEGGVGERFRGRHLAARHLPILRPVSGPSIRVLVAADFGGRPLRVLPRLFGAP